MVAKLLKKGLPMAVGFATGGPVGAAAAAYTAETQENQASRVRKQIAREESRKAQEMEIFGPQQTSIPTIQANLAATRPAIGTQSSGEGFFSTVRSGLREFGGFVQDAFASGIPQLFGVNRPRGVGQQPAITTTTNLGAQESQGSGSIQAGMGVALPSIIGGARQLLKSPFGQLALGGGAGLALSGAGTQGSGMRITRKMKSQARMVLNLAQGNISVAADILNISEDMLVMILLKRFRNDGPVVTKAALRKTKSTIRKMKNMCDMYDDLRPAARRRTTTRRAKSSTTLIKN